MDIIKKLKSSHFFSAKPDPLQVYTFSGESNSSDHLPVKQKRKAAKTVSEFLFKFSNEKKQQNNFESPYSEHLQTAATGTSHTVATSDNRTIHRKLKYKSVKTFEQKPSNRSTEARGPDGKFSPKESKASTTPERFPSPVDPTDTSPESQAIKNHRQREAAANHEPVNINITGKGARKSWPNCI